MSGTLSIYDLLAKRFQHTDTRSSDIIEDSSYQEIHALLANHNAIMRSMINDLAEFTTEREQGPQAMRSNDAEALRVISDQLEERGDDAGAAMLRDVAGRIEATAKPWFVDWPRYLGVGEMRVFGVEVNTRTLRDHGRYRWLIDAEPVGEWIVNEGDQPDRRVTYRSRPE